MSSAAVILVALTLEVSFGWPERLYRRIGHPVTWAGRLIAVLDRGLNRESDPASLRRLAGLATALGVIGLAAAAGGIIACILPKGPAGILIAGILAWPLIAARSLYEHVTAVARPLEKGDLKGTRDAVAMIVGRDPTQLDKAGVTRGALESLAENASDGVVAPVFWGVLFGLPGIAAYKAVNTLDSMIGHRSPRHEAFGWAAARVDDLMNLIPARLTGLLFALVSDRPRAALAVMVRDARHHRSPNAGWPEAAMAGALNIRLSGPRIYGDHTAPEPWINGTAPDPTPAGLTCGLRLYIRATAMLAVIVAILAVW